MDTFCLSTHGGAGYAPGSYWDGDVIVCGQCGARIENPTSTGAHWMYLKDWTGWLMGRGYWEPTFPEWLGGKKGVAYQASTKEE